MHKLFALILLSTSSWFCHAEINLKQPQRPAADLVRDVSSRPVETMALMQLRPGMTVLDLLGGGGYFSELISQEVGANGKVLLHNNQAYLPYVGKDLAARLADGHLKNVQRYDKEVENLELAENSLDAVFFVMGYHDMYHVSTGWKIDPQHLMGQIKKALKPNGLMLVIDHAAPDGSKLQHAQENHRIDEAYVKDELARIGFETVQQSGLLRNAQDSRLTSVFDAAIRGQTDRFVLVLQNKK